MKKNRKKKEDVSYYSADDIYVEKFTHFSFPSVLIPKSAFVMVAFVVHIIFVIKIFILPNLNSN